MNFKTQVERDITTVFHNSHEHADIMEFWINNIRYKCPVIQDESGIQERKKPSGDHADGLNFVDLVIFVPLSALKATPKKGQSVEIGDNAYTIVKINTDVGEIVLYLEMLSE